MLTVLEVGKRVNRIKKMVHDDEGAHSEEDDLYQYVLEAIAQGACDDPAACARVALKTKELTFARWCA